MTLAKSAAVRSPPGNDKRHVIASVHIEVATRACQRRYGRHRDVVAEDDRRGPGSPTTSVEDDVVASDIERRVDTLFDSLRRQFEPHRNAACRVAHFGGEIPVLGPPDLAINQRNRVGRHGFARCGEGDDPAAIDIARTHPSRGEGIGVFRLEIDGAHIQQISRPPQTGSQGMRFAHRFWKTRP